MSSITKSWSEMNGSEMFAAIMSSPALRQERKRAYALSRKIADGTARVIPQRVLPARSREIWHISPVVPATVPAIGMAPRWAANAGAVKGDQTLDPNLTYCLHPATGQPRVFEGFCLIYDGEQRNFRAVTYHGAVGSDFSKQPCIENGEVHMACEDGGSLVAIYKKGKCIAATYRETKVAVSIEAFMKTLKGDTAKG